MAKVHLTSVHSLVLWFKVRLCVKSSDKSFCHLRLPGDRIHDYLHPCITCMSQNGNSTFREGTFDTEQRQKHIPLKCFGRHYILHSNNIVVLSSIVLPVWPVPETEGQQQRWGRGLMCIQRKLFVVVAKDRFVGLVVKASSSRAEDLGFDSRLRRGDFSGSIKDIPYQWLKTGAWPNRVTTGTGWPDVIILWLGELESLICNFCLSVAARKTCLGRSVPEIH